MCCEDHHGDLPQVVAEALDAYRALHAEHGFDWGQEWSGGPTAHNSPLWWHHSRFTDWMRLFAATQALQERRPGSTYHDALWRLTSSDPPVGLVQVAITDAGFRVRSAPLPFALPGQERDVAVLVRASGVGPRTVDVGGASVCLEDELARLVVHRCSANAPDLVVQAGGERRRIAVVEPRGSGTLHVRSSRPTRWTVVDERGDGWFPDGRLHKWDAHGRPYFHAVEAELDVPAGRLHVLAHRGMEHHCAERTVDVAAGATTVVELEPERWYDAASSGWYGGDLHVHLNYSGDHVATPHDVAAMQDGEALHVLNLVAANQSTARVYDVEAFEHWVSQELPWSDERTLAVWGVEYRNDLLGHLHAFAPSAPPSRYHSGHARSDHPVDWPPNAVACAELGGLGATIGYTHPIVGSAITAASPAAAFVVPRSCEARELVADAALGLVDSVDLIGPASTDGPTVLYHRLLNTGLRLAATAGTDTMISMARVGPFSNPPGWARVYARTGQGRPTSEAWKRAIRAGRTVVTNGPWLTLDVAGRGPGDVIEVGGSAELVCRATCIGPGIDALRLIGPDGTIAEQEASDDRATLEAIVPVEAPTWVAAMVVGRSVPEVLYGHAFAHTTPVYVDVEGRRIGRSADARWCLEWLDLLEHLAEEHGRFTDPQQLQDLIDVVERAREFYRPLIA